MKKTSAEQSKHYRDKAFNKRMMDIRRIRAEMSEMNRESSMTPNLDRIRKTNRLKVFLSFVSRYSVPTEIIFTTTVPHYPLRSHS